MVVENVSSTAIRAAEYDPKTQQLRVTFVSDRTYVYEDVPASTYAAFALAESKGRYFNMHVRDVFEFHQE